MRNELALLMVFLSLVFLPGDCPGAQEQEGPFNRITVVSDDNYPPYIFRDAHGDIQGILVEQWKLWEKKTGIHVDLMAMDWSKALEAMEQGRADVIDTIFFTQRRAQLYDFSRPYARLEVPIFFQNSISGITGIESVRGFSVGVKRGDACIEVFKRNGVVKELVEYDSYEAIIKDAAKDRLRVFCIDKPPALYYLNKYHLVEHYRCSPSLYTGEFHRAVTKGRKDLLAAMEEGFSKISDEEYEAIDRKWFGAGLPGAPGYLRYIGIVLGAGVAAVVILLAFNLILRKRVNAKTSELEKTNLQLQEEISSREKVQQELKESETYLISILESNPTGTIIVEKDTGKITYVNNAAATMIGIPREEIRDRICHLFICPDRDNECPVDDPGRSVGRSEGLLIRGDGTRSPILMSVVTIAMRGKECLLESFIDISERKRAEEILHKSEEKYRQLAEAAHDLIVSVDLDFKITYANKAVLKFSGDIDPVGMCLLDVTPPHLHALQKEMMQKRREGFSDMLAFEWDILHPLGKLATFDIRATLLTEDGKPSGVMFIARDITESRQAKEALKKSEERYRFLAENARDVIWVYDLNMACTYISPSVRYLRGYTHEEALKQSLDRILTPESYRKAQELLDREYSLEMSGHRHGPDWSYTSEFEMVRKDGSTVWAEVTVNILYDKEDNPTGFMGISRDISERKKAAEEKKKLEDRLMQAQKMESIGTLAGGIAHDFNNLLTGILGNVSLVLLKMDDNNPLYERLKSIEEYVQRGSDLTKQLLGFARGGKYEVKPTDLGEFIRKSSEMFGRTKKEIRIHNKAQEELWTVDVDRGQMDQVLLNLYVNAWQAMTGGGDLYLSVENVELGVMDVGPDDMRPGKFVKITVTDTGTGMDEETRARIFEPFFTTKERGRGTGLGLASVYGIIKNHGGFIRVESEKGIGTSFMIYLPASDKAVEKEHKPIDEIQAGQETILLVDDEEMILDIGSRMLEGLGYKVITATGGRKGLQVYEENPGRIDLVILDMVMPDFTGKETFDALMMINPEVSVLLSSGYSLDSQAEEIMRRGCRGFIQKPFTMVELSKKIRTILDKDFCIPQ